LEFLILTLFLESLLVNGTEFGTNQMGGQPLTLDEENNTNGYLKYLTLVAPPSAQAAHYLARAVVLR
jgi:hypothetical protein